MRLRRRIDLERDRALNDEPVEPDEGDRAGGHEDVLRRTAAGRGETSLEVNMGVCDEDADRVGIRRAVGEQRGTLTDEDLEAAAAERVAADMEVAADLQQVVEIEIEITDLERERRAGVQVEDEHAAVDVDGLVDGGAGGVEGDADAGAGGEASTGRLHLAGDRSGDARPAAEDDQGAFDAAQPGDAGARVRDPDSRHRDTGHRARGAAGGARHAVEEEVAFQRHGGDGQARVERGCADVGPGRKIQGLGVDGPERIHESERLVNGDGEVVDLDQQVRAYRESGQVALQSRCDCDRAAELTGDALRRDQDRARAIGEADTFVVARVGIAAIVPEEQLHLGEADADDLGAARRGRLLEGEHGLEGLAQHLQRHRVARQACLHPQERTRGQIQRHGAGVADRERPRDGRRGGVERQGNGAAELEVPAQVGAQRDPGGDARGDALVGDQHSALRNRDRHERPCAVTETQARVLDGEPDVAGGVLFEGDAAGQLLAEDSEGDVRSTHLHAGFERERLAPEAHRLVGRRRVDPDVERAAHEHVGHVHGDRGRQAAEDATTRPA